VTLLLRLLLVLACSLALAACGGGDDEESSGSGGSGDTLSKAELIEKGDAVCKEGNERIAEIPDPQGLEDIATLAESTQAIATDLTADLRALKPPEEVKKPFDEFLALVQEGSDLLTPLRTAAEQGDEAKVRELLAEAEAINGRNDAPAREVGFKVCGVS